MLDNQIFRILGFAASLRRQSFNRPCCHLKLVKADAYNE